MKKQTIGVLLGGSSTEREVSLKTGKGIATALRKNGHSVVEIDFEPRNFIAQLAEFKVDVIFNALHGKFGEDGRVQGFLDICGIPYTGSGVKASSIAMDKNISKELFQFLQVPTPESLLLCKSEDRTDQLERITNGMTLPVIVKPSTQGSSVGVVKVEKLEELPAALEQAFGYDEEILVERFIQGRELTVAFLDGFGALPVIEIRPHSGAYDYKSKYTAGMTEYLVPAPISEELTQQIQTIACKVATGFHCRGISRLDIMLGEDGVPYVLEINTIPGMTETSLVPQAAAALNISYEELCEKILQSARHDG